ncbi:hypothetical protein [Amycolatopsis sp. cmx-4-61]|uniref:hypothetical protein n=1 Tax=Amycolatopsis sp. cmx-4-61 TaxID=2790937 RepID=UPI00397A812E
MSRTTPDLLDNFLNEADTRRRRVDRQLYPVRLLDITRQVRAAVPDANALLLDLSTRWERPLGPTLTSIRSTATFSAMSPPQWLRDWRSPQGLEWTSVVARVEQPLALALGLGEPDDLGWHHLDNDDEEDEWRLDLLDPLAVNALDTFQQSLFADLGTESQWIYLDFFSAEDGARHFARRAAQRAKAAAWSRSPRRCLTAVTQTPAVACAA